MYREVDSDASEPLKNGGDSKGASGLVVADLGIVEMEPLPLITLG